MQHLEVSCEVTTHIVAVRRQMVNWAVLLRAVAFVSIPAPSRLVVRHP